MEDDINRGMPTDRLLAEWLIDDDQKSGAAAGSGRGLPWILPAVAGAAADHAAPADPQLVHVGGGGGLVAVPASIDAVKQADRALMLRWRLAVRAALTSAFDAGLQAVDLLRDAGDGVGAYVLRRSP
jgi:predicted GNAT superfamily acetyltransferase